MAPSHKADDGSGVRRRGSYGYDEEADGAVDGSRDGVQVGIRSFSLDAPATQRPFDTHTSVATRPMSAGDSGRGAPSLNANEGVVGRKRKSDEIARNTTVATNSSGTSKSPSIRIDASIANESSDGANMPSASRSSRTSPTLTSPASPRSRNRGMSLRTSLFTRNFDRVSQTGDTIIEMQDVPSSSTSFNPADSDKKEPRTSVSVTQIEDDLGPPLRERSLGHGQIRLPSSRSAGPSRKGLQGISALPNYQQWVQDRANRHLPIRRVKKAYRRGRKFILRIQETPPSKDGRHIPIDPFRKKALIDDRTGHSFVNNFIKSSKYTPWNFLPRQLFAQFSKLANLYFLTVSILQMIPGLSTTGTYTTIIPLMCFVSISMAKEGYEDLRRHRLDKSENNREASVLHAYRPVEADVDGATSGPIHWAMVKWQSLQVGDIVKVERDEPVPADILLLDSKGDNNIAYIETMALDGETNLKTKQPSTALAGCCKSSEAIAALGNTEIVAEDPNLDLYTFEGKVSADGNLAPLTNGEVIYRGSILRNTPEIVGIILYTGDECKIRMNANKNPRIKAPSLQAVVNKIVIFMVIFVVLLSLFNTIAYQIWQADVESKAWYLIDAQVAFGPIIVSFVIMFNTMIPLSLYVSLEIIKVSQMFLMNSDVDMYDEASNTPFEARTSTINEELGQVSYIFSDKTGTLTENVMRFRKLSVAGTAWLHDPDRKAEPKQELILHKKRDHKGKNPLRRSFRKSVGSVGSAPNSPHPIEAAPRQSTTTWRSTVPGIAQPELSTVEMIRYIQHHPHTAFAKRASMMILSMALCHTCLPEPNADGDITYQASSPDERALVEAASELGYVFVEKDLNTVTIKTYPNNTTAEPMFDRYEVLDTIDFSSTRKRMSVVVALPDGRICVICKGADSVITERLRLAALAKQKIADVERRIHQRRSVEAQEALRRKSENVDRRSSLGSFPRTSMTLRNASIGRSSLARLTPIQDEGGTASPVDKSAYTPRPSGQLNRQSLAYSDYARSDVHDEGLVEEALVTDDAAVIERCFQHVNDFATEGLRTLLYGHRFLGEDEYRAWKKIYQDAITSLVDRQKLIEAAGELVEHDLELMGATAIEDKLQHGVPETIDRLRRANIKLWMLTGDKRETAINIGHSCRLIKDHSTVTVLDYEAGDVERKIAAAVLDIDAGGVAHSVIVIDGRTLGMLQAEASLHTLFLDLAILADSVVCCRASPSQKAHLVHAIRRRVSKSVTLAIGDGANDIAMIQESHVGIGITGKEGLQAARTADYAIAQFRFLNKLLLVHGHWNYVRTCKYTLGTFWKEMLFYLTQALYQRWNGYTGTSLYEQWSLSQFNTLFTSLPVIFLGIFEKDLAPATLIAIPELYRKGQRGAGFNFRVYLSWIFLAVCEAMIVFFTMRGIYGLARFTVGQDVYSMGNMTFSACVIIINTKLQVLEQRNRTSIALACLVIEFGGWFLFNIALSVTYKDNYEYDVKGALLDRFGRNPLWWCTLIIIIVGCLLYEIIVRAVKNALFPTDIETFQELEGDVGVRRRLEEASASELQAGWKHGKFNAVVMGDGGVDEEQAKREGEVQDLLDRPRMLEEGKKRMDEEQVVLVEDGSTEIHEMLSSRFGSVRRGELRSGV